MRFLYGFLAIVAILSVFRAGKAVRDQNEVTR